MTRRRWIADAWTASTATLTGAQAAHLVRVLRAQPGMEFDIVAGDRVCRGAIATASADAVEFTLGEELEADPALPVALLMAVFKFDRMEWAIEKATELGVARIVPVLARRTEKHLAQAAAARVERWRRIAREAAQQSRRSDTVVLEEAIGLREALRREGEGTRLLLAESERSVTLRDAIEASSEVSGAASAKGRSSILELAIGPEGGWTKEEEALFAEAGWKSVTLGPRILRAETAAIAAVSIVSALLE
jgi:16S rRNA (uracil1498-N3)-methyltransferase